MSNLTALNESTIRLIGSTQVITSVFSVVKELTENALDAGATTVDVRLENYGLDKVEVRDNGSGIPSQNIPFVAKRYHTSKIKSFSDIQHLETYGFRGEALGSLCTVSTLSITTKTIDDEVSVTYCFNGQGQITTSHPSHLTQGTTVTATSLFKTLPVRRQFYNNQKKKKDELKKIEDLLIAFSIILPKVRFTLTHDKERIFQKNVVPDTRNAILGIMGRNVLNSLVWKSVELKDPKLKIDMYLPSPTGDVLLTSRSDNSRCICAINNRPVCLKYVEKLIKQHYISHLKTDNHRNPVYFLSITIATDQLDVNVDPNKTTVLLHHKGEIVNALTSVLKELYGSIEKVADSKTNHHDDHGSDGHKGDNSSDFDESFSVHPVTKKLPNIPVIKIRTESNNQLSCVKDKTLNQGDTGSMTESKMGSNDKEKEEVEIDEDVSLTQLGKPVFQVIEDSLDDLINCNSEDGLVTMHSENARELTSNENMYKETNVPDKVKVSEEGLELLPKNIIFHSDPKVTEINRETNVLDKVKSKEGLEQLPKNISFQPDPKVPEIYSDIVSSWKDTQISQNSTDKISCNKSADMTTHSIDNGIIGDVLFCEQELMNGKKEAKCSNECQDLLHVEQSISAGSECGTSSGGDLWSKGQIVVGDSNIQPVSVLPGKRLLSLTEDEGPPQKKRQIVQQEGQPRLSDIVNSQPIKHPQSAFTVYCKENRSKVVAEHPLADFDKVTRILETRWESIPDEEKEKYFQKISPVTKKLKRTSIGSDKKERKLGKKMQLQNKSSQSWTTIKDQLLKQKVSSATQKVKDVPFSLQNLKTVFSQKIFSSQSQGDGVQINLIGPLKSSGVWVGCHGNTIKIVNPHRMQETVLYHNLMANHMVESERLEQPLQLTESYLGESLWATLTSMADKISSPGIYCVLQDKRLTANGIEITFHRDNGDISAKVTGLTRSIPVFGLADVKEVLHLVSTTRATTLAESRPLKVLNYLQGEAVRMARQLPRQQTKDDMMDLLIQKETMLPRKCENCLHNKPFYHKIFSLDDIPLSQSQT